MDRDRKKEKFILVTVSAISLIFSLGGWLKGTLPFDISWVAIILCGLPILKDAFTGLVFRHDIKADVLVAMALIVSVFIREYFAAGDVALIMAIGKILEDTTANKARQGIEKLIKLTPSTARVRRDGTEIILQSKEIVAGDVLIVLAGEAIAVDGVIISGQFC